MRKAVVRALVVLALVCAPLAPFGLVADDRPTAGEPGSVIEERAGLLATLGPRARLSDADPEPAPAVDQRVLVVVELKRGASLPAEHGIDVQRVYEREGASHVEGYLPLAAARELTIDSRIEAVRIEQARLDPDRRVAEGVSTIGADAIHARGATGANVTVGVIDSDFRVSDPELAGHVGAYRSFGTDADDDWRHGTAVASVLADTAPDASVHLAAVGETTTAAEYAAAVAWLRESGADVIVDSGSYFGQPGDGSGRLAAIAENASGDALFVTSAGNYGQRHWTGTHENETGDWVAVGPDTDANWLADGEPLSGEVTVSLRWDDWPTTDADYDLYLFRELAGTDEVVAVARASEVGGEPVEHLRARVPKGRYYVAVKAQDDATGHRLDLFASHRLSEGTPAGSLTAPATAPGVLAVGAYGNGSVRNYSSRGEAFDADRPRVDLVAPEDVAYEAGGAGGTSYAAPYVAGTAALLKASHPGLTPGQLRAILRSSAVDVGPEGPDAAAGYGLVDARAAAELADTRSRYAAVNESSA